MKGQSKTAVTPEQYIDELDDTLDWANEVQLLEPFPGLRGYMERMCARPRAALRIAAAFASLEQGA